MQCAVTQLEVLVALVKKDIHQMDLIVMVQLC